MDFFDRQRRLNGFGASGQEKLGQSTVLIAGTGGLGCPVALYLAAAGTGKIILVDGDTVDPSNLHRQILFGVEDIGRKKASTAAGHLQKMYPHLVVQSADSWITPGLLKDLIMEVDVIVDATDNFDTRFLLNDFARIYRKPLVHGAVLGFEGLFSVFQYPDPERGFDYRHLVSEKPPAGEIPACGEDGVLGVLPGIIGTHMAAEAIKIVTGTGEVISGIVSHFDLRSQRWYNISLQKNARIKLAETEADLVAGNDRSDCDSGQKWQLQGELLVDVREPGEICADDPVTGLNIPLADIRSRRAEWENYTQIVVFCQSGSRSKRAMQTMQQIAPGIKISHLEGGIEKLKPGTVLHSSK